MADRANQSSFSGQGFQHSGPGPLDINGDVNFAGRDVNIYASINNCLADLRSTDPRDDKKRIEQTKGGLLRDSYRWILTHHDFLRWRDDPDSRLLWIKGDPGKGKTMLLCGIIDELKEQTANTTRLLSFFFCQATDDRLNNATAILRGLIYLLVDQQRSLISHIQEKYNHAGKALFDDVNAWVALSDILTSILQDPSFPDTTLVIDALDECKTDLAQLLDLIIQLPVSSRVKWIPAVEDNWSSYLLTLTGHGGWVNSVAFSADGSRLASGSEDRTVKVWDAATGACLSTLEGHGDWVNSVAFSADGSRLASGSEDRTVKVWDAATGAYLSTLTGHGGWVSSVTFSADGSRLASGSNDRTVKVWDAATGACLSTLTGHGDYVLSVAFSADGSRLASGSNDRTVKVWDAATGACLSTLTGHGGLVSSVAFSADGSRLASGSEDSTVKVWDAATGACLSTLPDHGDYVLSVAFSADGNRLASGSKDRTVKVWDAATGACLSTLTGHGDYVRSVAFSADGSRLASGSTDRTVKVWDAATGACLSTFEGHGSLVSSVAFSADRNYLKTDTGIIPLPASLKIGPLLTGPQQSPNDYYDLGIKNEWITYNDRNLLWLPPDYRPTCSAVTAQAIAVGCRSGRVWMSTFSISHT
ncbi:hypothetical protein DL764_010226 [Monosporascus ibericus]|uniref:NACHT domain-containing protein n=1 Tax=Monosporascus ibericus TaxID=155417 RepID=A0A4Q4SVB8_9PEZI|nr:hypothetical protein DL764_010226 [Monosporascus ibericus]